MALSFILNKLFFQYLQGQIISLRRVQCLLGQATGGKTQMSAELRTRRVLHLLGGNFRSCFILLNCLKHLAGNLRSIDTARINASAENFRVGVLLTL